MNPRCVYCVSDHTGLTVAAVAKSVLAQFPAFDYSLIALPFIDTAAKAQAAAARIAASPGALVFSTLADPALRAMVRESGCLLFDVFDAFAPAVATALGQAAAPRSGLTHGVATDYARRIEAVHFTLALDDGLQPTRLNEADCILIGVSRVGKTPAALALALTYGLRAANSPLTPEDLDREQLSAELLTQRARLFGLTLDAQRLAAIRQTRYPDSQYASLAQCRAELAAARRLFERHAIPVLDTTRMSVEEIASRLRQALGALI
ncbi:MAG: pyruvate, phosphate dikinase/phosphoenolpyruvate synthase regulator [Thiobacillus sp.]